MKEKTSTFSDRLQEGLAARGLRQADLAKRSGIDKSSISRYLKKEYKGNQDAVYKLAQALNVSEGWLMGYDVPMEREPYDTLRRTAEDNVLNVEFDALTTEEKVLALGSVRQLARNLLPLPAQAKKVPLLGAIACGTPILAEENITDYVDLPGHIRADFALTCKGDSMISAGIRSGDVVYIRQQETVENGQIAAVMVGAEDATLKRFYHQEDKVTLLAENTAYPPMVYVGEEARKIHVIGLAVAFIHVLE